MKPNMIREKIEKIFILQVVKDFELLKILEKGLRKEIIP